MFKRLNGHHNIYATGHWYLVENSLKLMKTKALVLFHTFDLKHLIEVSPVIKCSRHKKIEIK